MSQKSLTQGDLQMFAVYAIISCILSTSSASLLRFEQKCNTTTDETYVVKAVGDSWTTPSNPCEHHVCEKTSSVHGVVKTFQEYCLLTCNNEFELIRKSGECCGECVQRKCKQNDVLHDIGTTWRSDDSCTIFECAEKNGEATLVDYKKSCPSLPAYCPAHKIITQNCCQYCQGDEEGDKKNRDSDTPDDISQYDTYLTHPCKRDCDASPESMTCQYKFTIEWYETLSKACYDCPTNKTDCDRPHCILADGIRRSVLIVNRMMPGPAIEVCENDLIVVDVNNHLMGESTTLHWHGLHQKENPFMDGVPQLSQCPIAPFTSFRYQFKADNPGTQFWHSHIGMQRGDGTFGALIIRSANDRHKRLYDYDEHLLIIQDWMHKTGTETFASHHHSIGNNKPIGILVNGKGRYYPLVVAPDQVTSTTLAPTFIEVGDMEATTVASDSPTTQWATASDTELHQGDDNKPHRIGADELENASEAFKNELVNENPKYSVTLNRKARDVLPTETDINIPLAEFHVKQGFKYLIRSINAEFLNCPVEISVDDHNITVISSDGYNIEPVEVSTIVTYAGERFDFIINANQPIGVYWMRIKGLMDCGERFTQAHQVAIVRYEGADPNEEPTEIPSWSYVRDGLKMNALNKGTGFDDFISIAELTNSEADDPRLLTETTDFKFYVYYDFYAKNNPHFHVPDLYGFHQVQNTSNRLFTPQLNHITMKMPSFPLMMNTDLIDDSQFCNASSLAAKGVDCQSQFCECPHVLQVPLNATVEMILIDEGFTFDANHPFHLHGHAYRVVAMERLASEISMSTVKEMDEAGLIQRRLKGAPIKDTVTIPDGGYTIIRFVADNPGYWLFHCHIEFHAEIGMALVLKIGEHSEMKRPPKDFPTCSNYMPNIGMGYAETAGATGIAVKPILLICSIIFVLRRFL